MYGSGQPYSYEVWLHCYICLRGGSLKKVWNHVAKQKGDVQEKQEKVWNKEVSSLEKKRREVGHEEREPKSMTKESAGKVLILIKVLQLI